MVDIETPRLLSDPLRCIICHVGLSGETERSLRGSHV